MPGGRVVGPIGDLVWGVLLRDHPGPYQVQAAIQAVHADAPGTAATDWRRILSLYDQLLAYAPGPVVALNRAVAYAEVAGPQAALAVVEALPLTGYYLFHAVRADLLRRLGRGAEAARAYAEAGARTSNVREREFLERRTENRLVVLHDISNDKYGGRVVARITTESGEDLGALLLDENLAAPYDGRGAKAKWC